MWRCKYRSSGAARVRVERLVQRMKQYKIITRNLDIELFPYIDILQLSLGL